MPEKAEQVRIRVRRCPTFMPDEEKIQWIEKTKTPLWLKLIRDTALACAFLLCVSAGRKITSGDMSAMEVFQSIEETLAMDWDETLGKLSFVTSLFPETAQVFFHMDEVNQAFFPVTDGEVVHTFCREEPFVSFSGRCDKVMAAQDGVVMSIAHGDNEEKILRIRHDEHCETIYGNLLSCLVQEGDVIIAGQQIGTLGEGTDAVFEYRIDGCPSDPTWLFTLPSK